MRRCGVLIAVVCTGACAENLLANPGFETLEGAVPARWHLFVMPRPGVEARLDGDAGAGQFAALLHNPTAYEEEPVNNWSQNVVADVAGKTVRLSGLIKTQDATEAALWIQAWGRPRTLRLFATTSTSAPVYGTRDWTPVSLTADVPEGTDFLVVRCVLLGRGKAWFDGLTLEHAPAESPAAGDPKVTERRTDEDGRDDVTETLIQANIFLSETVDDLQTANETLAEELSQLDEEIAELRRHLVSPPVPGIQPPRVPSLPAPPLVPHGVDWEELSPW